MRFPATHARKNTHDKIKIHFHPVSCTEKDWTEFWNEHLKSELTKALKYFVY